MSPFPGSEWLGDTTDIFHIILIFLINFDHCASHVRTTHKEDSSLHYIYGVMVLSAQTPEEEGKGRRAFETSSLDHLMASGS